MSRKRSLGQVLGRQWIAFGLLLLVAAGAMALLLMFLLEDGFIDHQLRGVAAGVVDLASAPMPERFELHALADAPPTWRALFDGRRPGAVSEFRHDDGRYLHVLKGRTPAGEDFLLAYDVSDQLRVNRALARAWPWLLAMAGILSLLAWGLANLFVRRISRRAQHLVERIAAGESPAGLDDHAREEPIAEFSELAQLAARAWQSRLQAVERERETLAFLAHELRTPLQSARTSLALLGADRGDERAWSRLRRSQDRLARASHAILWLASDAPVPAVASCEPARLVADLVDEFTPLAQARGQVLRVDVEEEATWGLPPEVAESVLANGLLNAIQHGGAGEVWLRADASGLWLSNPPAEAGGGAGFGFGLSLSERLLGRFGWSLSREERDRRVGLRIAPPAQTQPVA